MTRFKVLKIRADNDLETDIGIIDVTTDAVHKVTDFEVGKTYESVLSPYLYITNGEIIEVNL